MTPVVNKILVSVDFDQKKKISEGGVDLLLAKQYSHNRRESNAVVCRVENGNGKVANGTYLLVHHNRFVEHSPHLVEDNLYSLEWNENIFARLDENGNAKSLNGNVIVNYLYDDDNPLIPEHLRKKNPHKYQVVEQGFGFKKGQYVFAFPFADYEIVYVFNGQEKRVVKVVKGDIVAKVVK